MRWRTKPASKPGDLRERIRFALWPTAMDSGETIWLERYVVEQECMSGGYGGLGWYTRARYPLTGCVRDVDLRLPDKRRGGA